MQSYRIVRTNLPQLSLITDYLWQA